MRDIYFVDPFTIPQFVCYACLPALIACLPTVTGPTQLGTTHKLKVKAKKSQILMERIHMSLRNEVQATHGTPPPL